jgi:hypothetical protein
MRESETGEDAAQRIAEVASAVVSHARSFAPVVDEAYAVAKRRTRRDTTLAETLERFVADHDHLKVALSNHRIVLERIHRELDAVIDRAG